MCKFLKVSRSLVYYNPVRKSKDKKLHYEIKKILRIVEITTVLEK